MSDTPEPLLLARFREQFKSYELRKVLHLDPPTVRFLAEGVGGSKVVIKALYDADAPTLQRFKRESRILEKLDHANLQRVRTSGQTKTKAMYLVTDHIDGLSINEVLKAEKRLPIARACEIICEALDGLEQVHCLGVAHRNLTPDSILIEHSDSGPGVTVLTDFGHAKAEGSAITQDTLAQVTFMNRVGGLKGSGVGTPEYMAPELAYEGAGPESDLYSLSIVFVELIAGKIDWGSYIEDGMWADKSPVFFQHRLELGRPDMPPELTKILLKGLQSMPLMRWRSAADYRKAIRDFIAQQSAEQQKAERQRESIAKPSGIRKIFSWLGSSENPDSDDDQVRSAPSQGKPALSQGLVDAQTQEMRAELEDIKARHQSAIQELEREFAREKEALRKEHEASLNRMRMEQKRQLKLERMMRIGQAKTEDMDVIKRARKDGTAGLRQRKWRARDLPFSAFVTCQGELKKNSVPSLGRALERIHRTGQGRVILDLKACGPIQGAALLALAQFADAFDSFTLINADMKTATEITDLGLVDHFQLIAGVTDSAPLRVRMDCYRWSADQSSGSISPP